MRSARSCTEIWSKALSAKQALEMPERASAVVRRMRGSILQGLVEPCSEVALDRLSV